MSILRWTLNRRWWKPVSRLTITPPHHRTVLPRWVGNFHGSVGVSAIALVLTYYYRRVPAAPLPHTATVLCGWGIISLALGLEWGLSF